MGTPNFSVPALTSLIKANHDICIVYTQPPRPGGRGKKLQKTPIHKFAEDQGILVTTPNSLKTPEAEKMLIENMPIIPLYTYVRSYQLSPDVKGYNPHILDHHHPKFIYLERD